MARAPVLAAGGIVLRQEETPRIAVVRLRKRNEWVLPKGKLDDGETPRAAVERLSRAYERAFLANVGPLALEAAAAARYPRRVRVKQPVPEKRRGRRAVAPSPSLTPQSDLTLPAVAQDASPFVGSDVVEAEPSVRAA